MAEPRLRAVAAVVQRQSVAALLRAAEATADRVDAGESIGDACAVHFAAIHLQGFCRARTPNACFADAATIDRTAERFGRPAANVDWMPALRRGHLVV